MNLLSERVAHAIKVSGHTPSSVARAIGCTPAAVLQWISGSTKNIKNEYLFALADATGFEPRWIATGQGRELVIHDARKCKHCGCALIPQ